jgi:putative membrane protein
MAEGEKRNELAEERNELAEDRTLLANERTFAGWMRTGMAATGVGLGFSALFREMQPQWAAKAIATAFLLAGLFIIWAAQRRAAQVEERMKPYEVSSFGARNMRAVAFLLGAASLALIAAMWALI